MAVPWQDTARVPATLASPWRDAGQLVRVLSAVARPVSPAAGRAQAPWSQAQAVRAVAQAPWSSELALAPLVVLAAWASGVPGRAQSQVGWNTGIPAAVSALASWQDGVPGRTVVIVGWQPAAPAARRVQSPWNEGERSARAVMALWRPGYPVISYGGPWAYPIPSVIPPDNRSYQPPPGNAVALRFLATMPASRALRFGRRHKAATLIIPVQRVYMVNFNVSVTRVDTGDSIRAVSLSLSLDDASYAWGYSLVIDQVHESRVQRAIGAAPVELLAVVNGVSVRLIVDAVVRDRTFAARTVTVRGRGRTALLDDPFQPLAIFDNASAARTSQQLVDQALPSGWSADWGLTAWLVPAGAWSHQGRPISAARLVAAAGGGYLQPHATAQVLRVLPRYPVAPWDWASATPDIELPSSVCEQEGIETADQPDYNRVVIVSTRGDGWDIKRAGSAGNRLAQMITEPLATHADAGRQRGRAVLGASGRGALVRLKVPVLDSLGIVTPGKLVRYVDGSTTRLGLSRAVTVSGAWPVLAQSITLETHIYA